MGIPEQMEKKMFLAFSSVEKHFCQRQSEETVLAANSVMDRANKAKNAKNVIYFHINSTVSEPHVAILKQAAVVLERLVQKL